MKTRKLLDSHAILAWLQGEPAAPKVRAILERAREGKVELLMCLVNVGEIYYILRRDMAAVEVRALLNQLLNLPVQVVPVTEDLVWQAAEIKASNPISYADSFAVATAKQEGAAVVTGDPEFRRVEAMVEIEWLANA